jgi:hypothetical protein
MTNEPEPHPSRSSAADEEIRRRLDRARAELTGHRPAPDQRLEAMFLTGQAPVDSPDAAIATAEPEPLGTGASASPWRRVMVTAIAASFVLLVGLGAYAARRSGSDSPIEIAGATVAGSGDTVAGSGEDLAVGTGDQGDADNDQGGTVNDQRADGWEGLGPALVERLKALWTENRDWVDCVTHAIDTWAGSTGTDTGELRDLMAECGDPSLGDFDPSDLAIPGLNLDELQLPEFMMPDAAGGDMCETVETDTGTTITCHLPDGSWFENFGGLDEFEWPKFLEQLPGFERFKQEFGPPGTDGGPSEPANPDSRGGDDAGA